MSRERVELEGQFSPFQRACIGISVVAIAVTPMVYLILRFTRA